MDDDDEYVKKVLGEYYDLLPKDEDIKWEIDDEIDFICPPISFEGELFHLERWLDGLRECLELIDTETIEREANR